MTRTTTAILFLILLLSPVADARRIDGYRFADFINVDIGGKMTTLHLNGAGFLKKFWVKVYANSLYLLKRSTDAPAILDADELMAINLLIIYDSISLNELKDGLRDGFRYATGRDPAKLAPVLERSELFLSFFDRKTREGDVANFLYIPGEGTRIIINKVHKGTIPGLDFKKALFGIWLCEKPANRPLKAALLGRPAD